MKSKREMIMELCEFKNRDGNHEQTEVGRQIAYRELKQIITALLDRVEQLEGALEFYAAETDNRFKTEWGQITDSWGTTVTFDWGGDFADDPWEVARQALTATSPLDKLLEEEK